MSAKAARLLARRDSGDDDRQAWEMAAGGVSFNPRDLSAVTAWLRLQVSSQSGGEWTNWVDVLNSNPGAINSARRPAVAAAANGLPIATFATNDCVSVPLIANNNQTAKMGWAFWVKVGDLASTTALISVANGTGGSSAAKIQLFLSATEQPRIDAYISGTDGRRFTATSGITQDAWVWCRLRYNKDLGGDANATVFINGSVVGGSYANIGAGGTLTDLPTVTGNLLIGNVNDGAASSALNGSIGPNIFFLGDDITAAQEAALMNFERPT